MPLMRGSGQERGRRCAPGAVSCQGQRQRNDEKPGQRHSHQILYAERVKVR